MHDLVITNARICDGLGSAVVPGALAVKDGRISALGEDVGEGKEVVDAGVGSDAAAFACARCHDGGHG
jgi:N-acyl-D-aspartate/D-glutamate deacylase